MFLYVVFYVMCLAFRTEMFFLFHQCLAKANGPARGPPCPPRPWSCGPAPRCCMVLCIYYVIIACVCCCIFCLSFVLFVTLVYFIVYFLAFIVGPLLVLLELRLERRQSVVPQRPNLPFIHSFTAPLAPKRVRDGSTIAEISRLVYYKAATNVQGTN